MRSKVDRRHNIHEQKGKHFWLTRPVTDAMNARASGDMHKLFVLQERQLKVGEAKKVQEKAQKASAASCTTLREKKAKIIHVSYPGIFMGAGGVSIRSLELRSGTNIYSRGRRKEQKFMVFYTDEKALRMVVDAERQSVPRRDWDDYWDSDGWQSDEDMM